MTDKQRDSYILALTAQRNCIHKQKSHISILNESIEQHRRDYEALHSHYTHLVNNKVNVPCLFITAFGFGLCVGVLSCNLYLTQ